ncbi:uncharacterized protein LOC126574685 [Anopheles aquasalis]|uniref:uncharacterized protein LOC126574685 n=1 Tax=Anopheles aquasalis TaxID=42839 RepID=UPI00215A73BE|nr:uncharacterized protein LOC126574685 [Anopheles aquasalis]
MAILLVHLRRILLLITVVYLAGELGNRLLHGGGMATGRIERYRGDVLVRKAHRLHVQPWAYIYTMYLYALLLNGGAWNERNLFDNFFR